MRTAGTGGTLLETRGYNTLGQLTRITVPGVADLEYRYAAGQNNGRITQMKDWISGEEVSYSYDTLNRLIQAVTTGPQYGLNFSYDGFGNLTQEQVFKGTGYNTNLAYDGTTNRIATPGYGYDGNGNLTAMPYLAMSYDMQNRLIQTDHTTNGTMQYGYNPGGQRVWKRNPNSENFWFIDYYGADGKLMSNCWAQFQDWDPILQQRNVFSGACNTERLYFGGKHVRTQAAPRLTDYAGVVIDWAVPVTVDRLGSAGTYYPYGEARSSPSEFATYQRDNTGLDYAQNRYYSSQIARFTTADPYVASGGPKDPQSWNRYAYVQNDPVNFHDPRGLYLFWVGDYLVTCPDGEYGGYCDVDTFFHDASVPVIDRGNTEGGGSSVWIRSAPIAIANPAPDWRVASEQLGRARDRIVNTDFSQDCTDTLALLGATPAQVVQAAGAAQFNNALTSTDTRASLYANSPAAASAATQFGSQTIENWFQSDPTIMAAAELRGDRIFFRPSGVDASDLLFNSSLVMHELLHNITGFSDSTIMDRLGLSGKSDWINSRLYDDCF
jgi:RHS repeat-associated protein